MISKYLWIVQKLKNAFLKNLGMMIRLVFIVVLLKIMIIKFGINCKKFFKNV